MKKLLLVSAALCSLSIAGPARSADMPTNMAMPPAAAPIFTWTSCYLGAHAGGGFASSAMTDPVQLVESNIPPAPGSTGITTANVSPAGVVVGAQIGCDYQYAPSWVVGIEGAGSGSSMRGSTSVGLPAGAAGDTALFTAKTDFIPSVTARFGYAIDRWLLYVKGGAAWAGDEYSVTGNFTGTPFDFEGNDLRFGWTAGVGVEWAFSGSYSAKLEYDFYQFGHDNVLMSDAGNAVAGPVDVKQSVQIVKAGVSFHMWDGQ
jgi:opacity protein-like surface antigen